MMATPPDSLASRSWSFSRSKSLVVSSMRALIWAMRSWIACSVPWPSTKVVSSLVETTLRARPQSSMVAESSFRPTSSLRTVPPVRMAMSCSISLRRSPKPGALMERQLSVPRSLLTTRVASASPSTSSAMRTRFFVVWRIFSSAGSTSLTAEIFLSVMRMQGSSTAASMRWESVRK